MGALGAQCWSELSGRRPTVLLPLGACEQHGPHLPLQTDADVAGEVARHAGESLAGELDVLVAPVQPYGASGEHEGFPGTVSLGHDALRYLLVELGRSLCRWAGRLLVVNAHGGNLVSLRAAVATLLREGRDVAWWPAGVAGGDAHAGRTETSMMLALRPDVVRMRHAHAGRTEPLGKLLPELAANGVRDVSPTGVLGDPTGSTAEQGRDALEGMAQRLAEAVRSWHVEDGLLVSAARPASYTRGEKKR